MLASGLENMLAVYSLPRPLINADLCLCGGLPLLMAGYLNAKYKEWNSRLIISSGKSLREYPMNIPV